MNLDLLKYIFKLSVIPMLFVSLVLITHGADDGVNGLNVLGFVLLIISGTIIINNAKNNKDEESK